MNAATTPSTPPPSSRLPRSLRDRWRIFMILGLNLLVVIIAGAATLITILEQRLDARRLHENTAVHMRVSVETATQNLMHTLTFAAQSPVLDTGALLAAHPALQTVSLVDTGETDLPYTGLTDEGLLLLAVPVGDGALIAQADPGLLWGDAVTPTIGQAGYGYVVSTGGEMLAVGPDVDVRDPARRVDFAILDSARSGTAAMRLYDGLEGRWVVGRAEPIPGTDLVILTETPLSEFTPVVLYVLVMWVLALGLTAAIGEVLIRRILRTVIQPLEVLRAGAHAVEAGDYGYRVRLPANADRELAELGDDFNVMIQRLQTSQQQIDAYTHQMEEIVDLRARELSRKAMQLEVAADVSRKIATIHNPRALIAEVVKLIQERFQVYHVEIWLVDEGEKTISPGRQNHPLGPIALRDDTTSVIAWVARHGDVLYVPDVTQDSRYRRADTLPAVQSELAIPLKFGDRVIGVLNLEADHRAAFPKDEIAVLQSLANEIAVSIHNAQMFAALESANRELAQASLEAKQAHMLKSRFLLNASHKLRTPLNVIIGYSETITSGVYGELSEKVLDRQRRILDNGRHLQALIEDMLDLSSIETDQMELDMQWLDLKPLLDEVLIAARALHQTGYVDHDLTLSLDTDNTLPPIWGDVDRLRYILINLMSNAVKFTEAGEIIMAAEADEEMVYIHVSDTGPGIGDDELGVLFEPFQHQHGSTASGGKGTGLGLTVSRLLALKHGGDLRVHSVPGEGSTFTLCLPREPIAAPLPLSEENR